MPAFRPLLLAAVLLLAGCPNESGFKDPQFGDAQEPLAVMRGGTGARTTSEARANLGLELGTAPGNVVQLDSQARLPAVNGSLLTGTLSSFLSTTVTGSDRTEVTVNGLDLAADRAYYIISKLLNPTVSVSDYRLYLNGDTTAANYFATGAIFFNSAVTHISVADATFMRTGTNFGIVHYGTLTFSPSGRHAFVGQGIGEGTPFGASSVINFSGVTAHNSTVNVTSFTISATVANTIGVGSEILVYRLR